MLPDNSNWKDVLLSLPPDVQALVLLYNNGADKNITSKLVVAQQLLRDRCRVSVESLTSCCWLVRLPRTFCVLRCAFICVFKWEYYGLFVFLVVKAIEKYLKKTISVQFTPAICSTCPT